MTMTMTTTTKNEEITITRHGVVLEKTELAFENEGVFNAACIRVGDRVHMFYRAVRMGNYSSIGHCIFNGPLELASRKKRPVMVPEHPYEAQGMEDPRITRIEDTYYMTYSAYDGSNVLGAFATSTDLKAFTKHAPITPRLTYRAYKKLVECCADLNPKYLAHYQMLKEHGLGEALASELLVWDKNLMFFPRKFNGKFALLHRLHPGIQLVYFNDPSELTDAFWVEYIMDLKRHTVMDPKLPHESSHIGGGAPPIETEDGWLFIYHAAEETPKGLVYHACAALLDRDDPRKVLARLNKPLISPETEAEQVGVVRNIVFPSGVVEFDGRLYIYYGGADERIAVASVDKNELLQRLKNIAGI